MIVVIMTSLLVIVGITYTVSSVIVTAIAILNTDIALTVLLLLPLLYNNKYKNKQTNKKKQAKKTKKTKATRNTTITFNIKT